MELKFNEAKTVHPNHLERCLCYDKFLKGYRCYVYDDISKYWCTQATTEHDPNGDNHIVDYADYQVTKWASLQQEQPQVADASKMEPEVDLEKELDRYLRGEFQQTAGGNFNNYIQVARHFYELGLNARKEE